MNTININWTFVIIGIILLVVIYLIYRYYYGSSNDDTIYLNTMELEQEQEEEKVTQQYNFISILFPNVPQYFGSQIIVKTPNSTYLHTFKNQDDDSLYHKEKTITFPLESENIVETVRVRTLYGDDIIFNNPRINSVLRADRKMQKLSQEIQDLKLKLKAEGTYDPEGFDNTTGYNNTQEPTLNFPRYPYIEYEDEKPWKRFDSVRY